MSKYNRNSSRNFWVNAFQDQVLLYYYINAVRSHLIF